MELHEGFSERINDWLDKHNLPKGKKRPAALADMTNTSTFTARQMLYKDSPCKDSTLLELISMLEGEEGTKETFLDLKYGAGPEKFLQNKNDVLIGHIAIRTEEVAKELNVNLENIPAGFVERIWNKTYSDACQNNGQINESIIAEMLKKLKEFI